MSSTFPKLIAFDLDGTVWTPDMYELWGGGAPFKVTENPNQLLDSKNQTVQLCGSIRDILQKLKNEHSDSTKVCYVSCTDEPTWAAECLDKFACDDGTSLADVVDSDLNQIYKSNKRTHFSNLHQMTNIKYDQMLFFDNERHNCTSVSKLGVICIHCQNGMNQEVWESALETFASTKQ
jgi:magnesium-dependent phosphatase 1